MTIRVALSHKTHYAFDRPVAIHPHVVRLRPAPHCRTPVSAYSLQITPSEHFINWQQDPFGNYLARIVFPEPASSLEIDVSLIADMTVINPFDFFLEEYAERYPFRYEPQLMRDLAPYLDVSEQGPKLKAWLAQVDTASRPLIDFLVDVNQRLQKDVSYLVRLEPGVQSCEQTLALGSGSCRDSGWLLVQILRSLGLAARFASGYLVQLKPDVEALDGPSGATEDFTDLHAWAEVYIPGAGWVGLDPTSGLLAGEGHIPLACTPTPATAAPITGATGSAKVDFQFSNTVTRMHEDPRVTKPYDDEQWQDILTLGDQVDAELKAGDVRLTMGGEPTFVSIDDMDGAEWNYTADSAEKRRLAAQLLKRLQTTFAPHAIVHFGQGKWYPGEPLPRWAMSLFWRTDGEPQLDHPEVVVTPSDDADDGPDDAKRLIERIAEELGLATDRVVAGYEDVAQLLLQEGRLPVNVSPEDSKLKDPMARKRLTERFTEGLGAVVGYALPLKWQAGIDSGFWKSSRWPFRGGHMFLVPGDSPMGFRLPLASLPWEDPAARELPVERDPFAPRESLPAAGVAPAEKSNGAADGEIVHTAVCVQARQGVLYVFLPPLDRLEDYLSLLGVVTGAAKKLKLNIVLEGYEPPRDPRLRLLQVTPDPGVIEVNVHPASGWRELVDNTEKLYEQARQSRLGTEKFMLDGGHSGTGGGNHVTLGASEAADSPFLRRPDLLRSFIAYWQRHPSLSYLFSGLFIGPTSQAPRVDEARDDNLYELEIAFDRLPDGPSEQPWLVDRVLRNFLVDLTGNTHRAEFSIDKLYAPQGPAGRKGLVEFRAFEMPPHARMSLVQMLLIRAMVARFWQEPYRRPLIRWGTELHDRFMLRDAVWNDFSDVLADMSEAGYRLASGWFEPFREFRFPKVGELEARGMHLEIHRALEPWHVLGEEASQQGTSRYVDSSLERLQVAVTGLAGDRYVVTCNGRVLPLQATRQRGRRIAGVRFKAWHQHSSLHPTIGVHAPLVFDIVDMANQRSIAGATYYVAHPGGRNYDTFPLNANEAEARRAARFVPRGATPDTLVPTPEPPHPDQPYTLDLRTSSTGG